MSNEKINLVYSMAGFNRQIDARNHYGKERYDLYYNYTFYGFYEIGYAKFSEVRQMPLLYGEGIFVKMVNTVYFQIKMNYLMCKTYPQYWVELVLMLMMIAPIYVILCLYLHKKYKECETKQLKLFFILVLMQFPITLIAGILCSPDMSRWLSHAFLIQFALFFYIIYYEKEEFSITLSVKKFWRVLFLAVYYIIYAFTYVDPYQ